MIKPKAGEVWLYKILSIYEAKILCVSKTHARIEYDFSIASIDEWIPIKDLLEKIGTWKSTKILGIPIGKTVYYEDNIDDGSVA